MIKYTRITFLTVDQKSKKEARTLCFVFNGKATYKFASMQQAEITFKKMVKDDKKVFMSRGLIHQIFLDKTRVAIVKILREDAQKGAENTQDTNAPMEVKDWKEENIPA